MTPEERAKLEAARERLTSNEQTGHDIEAAVGILDELIETPAPTACGSLTTDDRMWPCELVAGHLCAHAILFRFGAQIRTWVNLTHADAGGPPFGAMEPQRGLAPLETAWPWFSPAVTR